MINRRKQTGLQEKVARTLDMFNTSATTITERIHELMGNGIIVRKYQENDDPDLFLEEVDLRKRFKCYQDGIEIKANCPDESADEVLNDEEFARYKETIFRYLLITDGPSDQFIYEFYLS